MNIFKKITNKRSENNNQVEKKGPKNKETAKERLHLVLMQDRANVSADFLELMKQEIIGVIKKYIDVDENEIDVKLTNKQNNDGTTGAPALYANIPIRAIKDSRKYNKELEKTSEVVQEIDEHETQKQDDNLEINQQEEIRIQEEPKPIELIEQLASNEPKETFETVETIEEPKPTNKPIAEEEKKSIRRGKHSLEEDFDTDNINNDIHKLVESSIEKDELSIKQQAETDSSEKRKKRTVTAKEISVIKEQQAKKAASKTSRTKKLVDKIQTAKASTQSRLKHAKELSNIESQDSNKKTTK